MSENWPLDEQHFWPGKSYDYNGYVDVIAAGKRLNNEELRPNMLTSKYINELERINEVFKFLKQLFLVYNIEFNRSN